MNHIRAVEFTFFYGVLALVGFMIWQIFAPFITALILSGIIVIICYPLYEIVLKYFSRKNRSVAAFLTTVLVFTCIAGLQNKIQVYIPSFDINITEQLKASVGWFTKNIGAIFAGTISFVFSILISILGSFYLFRDGKDFVNWLFLISPLNDTEDKAIFDRVARSIRSVVTGTVLVSMIQGMSAAIGFSIFGIDKAILWGTVGALIGLLPGVGSAGIMVPAVLYLFLSGSTSAAIGLSVWGVISIVIIDNLISPYLMGRGSSLHPFVVLISVLGGISLFGPIGFILGPVFISLFMVLLEIYSVYMDDNPNNLSKIKKG
jgi:predicted PurR-regulated permease PerM